MKRRSQASIAANPVLIGAATVLVIVVAVFLAYNANSGLPFVPTYSLKADVPSAAQLVKGNEVRLGGVRVGVVDEIKPKQLASGRVVAQLGLKLETTVKPLPADSTLLVRPRSALGLKYVEITKGTKAEGYEDGATIALGQATPAPVEFDEFLSTFDEPTRVASRANLTEFGNALGGRGQDLNVAIENLNPLLVNLQPVMRNLSDPQTKLARLFRALGATAAEVAPVAQTQAAMFRNLDTTFGGLANVTGPIQESITGGPPALDAAIRGLPRQRPFIRNTEAFFAELRPGVRSLSTAAPTLADALEIGTPVLRRTVELNRRLKPTFQSLQRFAEDPLAKLGLNDLAHTSRVLAPTIRQLKPAQTVCNYVSLWFRNVSSLLSQGDANGTGQRFIIIATPQGPNNEGLFSSAPANGPGRDNYLHSNAYPNVAAPGQTRECEAANETYAPGKQVIGNVPGNQGTRTEKTVIDRR
ncbi:MAG: Mammalian cell entry related domain protein [Solirubrobacterales bacterium]|nr:Mammalian cell entry related domain protein [Solirubrobacterales bacterium]